MRKIIITYFKFPEKISIYLLKISKLENFRYIVGQVEPTEDGRLHIQAYAEFTDHIRVKEISNIMPGCHYESKSINSSREQGRFYCMKDYNGIYNDKYQWTEKTSRDKKLHRGRLVGTDYYEFGTWDTEQGKRTDIETIKAAVLAGDSLKTIVLRDCKSYQHIRICEKFHQYFIDTPRDRNIPPEVRWYYGPTGISKSRSIYDEFEPENIYPSSSYRWWNGYTQQKVILIDDMRKDYSKFHVLLKLLDRYPLAPETKGSTININSEIIIITSPKHPCNLFDTREDLGQLIRRISTIKQFHRHGPPIITQRNETEDDMEWVTRIMKKQSGLSITPDFW